MQYPVEFAVRMFGEILVIIFPQKMWFRIETCGEIFFATNSARAMSEFHANFALQKFFHEVLILGPQKSQQELFLRLCFDNNLGATGSRGR